MNRQFARKAAGEERKNAIIYSKYKDWLDQRNPPNWMMLTPQEKQNRFAIEWNRWKRGWGTTDMAWKFIMEDISAPWNRALNLYAKNVGGGRAPTLKAKEYRPQDQPSFPIPRTDSWYEGDTMDNSWVPVNEFYSAPPPIRTDYPRPQAPNGVARFEGNDGSYYQPNTQNGVSNPLGALVETAADYIYTTFYKKY